MVPTLGALGGVISIVTTEFETMAFRIFLVKKYLNVREVFRETISYAFSGILASTCTILISNYLPVSMLSIIIEGIACSLIYVILLYLTSPFVRNNVNKFKKKKEDKNAII